MRITSTPVWLSSLSLALFSIAIHAAPAQCCAKEFHFTDQHRESMMKGYMSLWNGDFSKINDTLMDSLVFHMDRHPVAGNGTAPTIVKTPEEFIGLSTWSRQGWQKFTFSPLKWIGENNIVTLRWVNEATMGTNFTKMETTLKPGEKIEYNGNDFLTLDKCTGKIAEIELAQDFLNFFYDLGVKMLPL